MSGLTRDTVLERITPLRMEIDSSNQIHIPLEGGYLNCGPHTLAILDAFHTPLSVDEALKKISPLAPGGHAWMNLMNGVVQLYKAGILRDLNSQVPTLRVQPEDYDAAAIHVEMLSDRARTDRFLKGIADVVRPGDVVIDLGTGTGVLAIAAAQAGAKQVYALEASAIGRIAEQIIAENGVSDRVTVVRGWSTDVTLPEPADVLISEMIGNEPLGEQILELTLDARKRLLKPNARLVPDRLRLYAQPVVIPESYLDKIYPTKAMLADWRQWYGISFDPLLKAAQLEPCLTYLKPQNCRDWCHCAKPGLLKDLDLTTYTDTSVTADTTLTITRAGVVNGLLILFDAQLGPNSVLSMLDDAAIADCHWRLPLWILAQPIAVEPGDQLRIDYLYRVAGRHYHVELRKLA